MVVRLILGGENINVFNQLEINLGCGEAVSGSFDISNTRNDRTKPLNCILVVTPSPFLKGLERLKVISLGIVDFPVILSAQSSSFVLFRGAGLKGMHR